MQSMSREENEIEIVDYSSAISHDMEECIPREMMVAETNQTFRIASENLIISTNADHDEEVIAASPGTAVVEANNININIPADDIKLKKKLFELVLVISFTAIFDLWKPFGKNDLIFMMSSLMFSFYFTVNGVLLNHKYPGSNMVKAYILIALLTFILPFTILLSILLPSYLNWLPWFSFASIVGLGRLVFLGVDVNSVYQTLRRQIRHY